MLSAAEIARRSVARTGSAGIAHTARPVRQTGSGSRQAVEPVSVSLNLLDSSSERNSESVRCLRLSTFICGSRAASPNGTSRSGMTASMSRSLATCHAAPRHPLERFHRTMQVGRIYPKKASNPRARAGFVYSAFGRRDAQHVLDRMWPWLCTPKTGASRMRPSSVLACRVHGHHAERIARMCHVRSAVHTFAAAQTALLACVPPKAVPRAPSPRSPDVTVSSLKTSQRGITVAHHLCGAWRYR